MAAQVCSVNIEAIRVRKYVRIAIGRTQHAINCRAGLKTHFRDLTISNHVTGGRLHGAQPPQGFFDYLRQQNWLGAQPLEHGRMLEQGPQLYSRASGQLGGSGVIKTQKIAAPLT
jgi:hypothetical protein